jgi:hypothetical protein
MKMTVRLHDPRGLNVVPLAGWLALFAFLTF